MQQPISQRELDEYVETRPTNLFTFNLLLSDEKTFDVYYSGHGRQATSVHEKSYFILQSSGQCLYHTDYFDTDKYSTIAGAAGLFHWSEYNSYFGSDETFKLAVEPSCYDHYGLKESLEAPVVGGSFFDLVTVAAVLAKRFALLSPPVKLRNEHMEAYFDSVIKTILAPLGPEPTDDIAQCRLHLYLIINDAVMQSVDKNFADESVIAYLEPFDASCIKVVPVHRSEAEKISVLRQENKRLVQKIKAAFGALCQDRNRN